MMVRQHWRKLYVVLLVCSCVLSSTTGIEVVRLKRVTTVGTSALFLALVTCCIAMAWRWWASRQAKPPWGRFAYASQHRSRLPFVSRLWLTWQLARLTALQQVYTPTDPPIHTSSKATWKEPYHAPRRSLAFAVRWPRFPTVNLHFVRPHTLSPRAEVTPSYFGHLVQETEQIISEITANPPRLLALHVQPRQLVYEFNYSAPLSAVEQRAIVRRLHAKRRKGQWIEEQHLAVQYTGFSNTAVVNDMIGETKRWMPVMNNGRTTVWWPLRQNQHVVLAGSVEKIVTGFLEHIRRLPEHQQPTMILHDADDRLVAINDTLASLRSSPDALAQARSLQLAHQFDERHEHHMSNAPMPVCIVVAPSATDWPDVQPLLSAKSGVQVVLVLGEGVPIAPLRAVCHQLWMIHTPDSRFATLPDAFRPAGLPTTRDGRVLAWSPGGRTVWQGTPLQQAPTVHSPCEDEERGS